MTAPWTYSRLAQAARRDGNYGAAADYEHRAAAAFQRITMASMVITLLAVLVALGATIYGAAS